MAVYTFRLEGNFGERAAKSLSETGGVGTGNVLKHAVDYVQDDYLPALFYEHHGIPAWAPPKMRKGKPLVDTASLATSWVSQITGETAEIGSTSPYAHVHSEGREDIVAKNKSGLLWIPNPEVFGESQKRVIRPKDIEGLFRPMGADGKRQRRLCLRVGSGNLYGISVKFKGDKRKKVAGQKRKDAAKQLVTYFFGVPSVTIPARPIIAGIPNPIFEEGMGFVLQALVENAWAA